MGELHGAESISRQTRSDADLREGRLRSEAAVSGDVHRAGSVCARRRLCGIPGYCLVLQVREAGRGRSSEPAGRQRAVGRQPRDRKSTRLNSSHSQISYAVFCLKKKKKKKSKKKNRKKKEK